MHWKELAVNQTTVPLDIDKKQYVDMQTVGILRNICVYKDGKLIGYSVFILKPSLHYASTVFAHVDVIYIDPSFRGGTVGARLLCKTEEYAKQLKADVIIHHAKPNVPAIIQPLYKLGYSMYEYILGKYVGDK